MGKNRQQKSNGNDSIQDIIQALENLTALEFISESTLFQEDFQNIINRLKDDSFRLAIVGEFSSGKSTFLNALIGKDILKHGAKETTATITEIENRRKDQKEDVFDVYYENGSRKENISISLLGEYTATNSTTHSVAQEIKKVVIKSHIIDSDGRVCFVDTPGLNGMADNHREKTIEQIKNAHACIYLLQVRGLGQSDIDFIQFISKYQHNLIFVQNFIDELKELEGETVEEKLKEQSKILKEKVFPNESEVSYKLLGISARKALIAKDIGIKTYNNMVLDNKMREQLYQESRFETVRSAVAELMRENEKSFLQKKDAIAVALELLKQLLDVMNYRSEQEETKWDNSVEGKKRKGYEQIRKLLIKNKQDYLNNIQNFIESETADVRKSIFKIIEDRLNGSMDEFNSCVNQIKNIEDFESFVSGDQISQYLYEHTAELEKQCNNYMNQNFDNILCNAVLRVKQYIGSQAPKAKDSTFQMEGYHIDYEKLRFEEEENEVSKMEKELAQERGQLKKNREKQEELRKSAKESREDLKKNEDRLKSIIERKDREIAGLGSKPEAEEKYKTETYPVYRGGLGILDKVLGPKMCERTVPYMDKSKQAKWLSDKSNIETRYNREQNQIKATNRYLNEKIQNCEQDLSYFEKTEPQKQNEVTRMEKLLKAKKQYLDEKRNKAQKEYLRDLKGTLTENVKRYLFDDVSGTLSQNFESAVMDNKQHVYETAEGIFNIAFEARLAKLSEAVGEKGYTVVKTKEHTEKIKNTITILEEYICRNR